MWSEFSPSPEILSPASRFVDLLDLKGAQERELREQVVKHNGEMWVAVHPYYFKNRNWGIREHERKVLNRLDRAIERIASSPKGKYPPTMILEEEWFYHKELTPMMINRLKESDNTMYCLPTFNKRATPVPNPLPENFNPGVIDSEIAEQAWDQALTALANVGVERLLVAGTDFEIGPAAESRIESSSQSSTIETPEVDYHYCVGDLIKHAKLAGFAVDVAFTIPHGRADMRRLQETGEFPAPLRAEDIANRIKERMEDEDDFE